MITSEPGSPNSRGMRTAWFRPLLKSLTRRSLVSECDIGSIAPSLVMATLAGQRAQFTWALRQYNLAEDAEKQAFYALRMAKYVATAPANGFTVEDVTQEQPYPKAEVAQYLDEASTDVGPDISEGQALREVEEAVDVSDVVRLGEGPRVVYAYGYRCARDRLKIGLTEGDTVQRVAAQI